METNERSFDGPGEWPSQEWCRINLWLNEIRTAGVIPRTDTAPQWACRVCPDTARLAAGEPKRRWHPIKGNDFKPALRHIRSKRHQQNFILSQLEGEKESN